MSLSIKYTYPEGATTLYLYLKVGEIIDIKYLPDNPIELSSSESEYVVEDSVEGELYSVVLKSVDANGFVDIGNVQNICYVADPGPGNKFIQRGYPDFGVYGELTNEEFGISPEALRAKLINEHGLVLPGQYVYGAGGTSWYKCLVDGKVIFIPKNYLLYRGRIDTNSNATLMIQDGLISKDPYSGKYTFDGCPEVIIGGYKYRWRGMKAWVDSEVVDDDLTSVLKVTTENYVNWGMRNEAVMFGCLSNTLTSGYDPLNEGYTHTSNQPPFDAGESETLSIVNTNNLVCVPGNVNFPNVGGNTRILLNTGVWTITASTSYGTKHIPVLE